MADLEADIDATRSLTCRQCGESLHRFVEYDGIPYPPQECTEPTPEGTADEDRTRDDEPVGQPIWRCQRCRSARHGPDPNADTEQPDDDCPNESTTGEGRSEAMMDEYREIFDLSLDGASEVERGEPSELEHLVLNAMETLDEGEGVDRERLVAVIQTDHTVAAADIENAIESLLVRGECYELTDTTVKPL